MKKEACLSIVHDVKNNKFLMIKHNRGVNQGYLNFPGGKKELNENMLDCVHRETMEETGIVIKNPKQVGYIEFPTMDFYVHVFITTDFSGNIVENENEVNVFWQDADNIPYDKMRAADTDFLPIILSGKYVKKRYFYDEDFNIAKIEEIDDQELNL